MNERAFQKLVEGYQAFYKRYQGSEFSEYRETHATGQKPGIMTIACSDSRVNPALLTQAGLGEIFMVNNVANLVPPYKEGKDTHHSTSAAIEYAVQHLKVSHIIILGHSGCGGIKALMEGVPSEEDVYSFIEPWMQIAKDAKETVKSKYADLPDAEQLTCCEKESLQVSLRNLRTFPWVAKAIEEDRLQIHAWYFDVPTGDMMEFMPEPQEFMPLREAG